MSKLFFLVLILFSNSNLAQNYFHNSSDHYFTIDSIIINVSELDTLDYFHKFNYWKEVNITNGGGYPLLVADLNQNGYPELFGFSGARPSSFAGPVIALELNPSGAFDYLFSYDSTILVKAVGDIKKDGRKSIYFHSIPTFTQSGIFYTAENLNSIPTIFDFVLNFDVPGYGFQINDMSFGDFNNNGIMNCAFVSWDTTGRIVIAEYDSCLNNFYTVFEFDTFAVNAAGFAISDFDNDGKDEIIFNYDEIGFFAVEADDNNNFQIIQRGNTLIDYPWLHAVTNDIDGNDQKEFWFGGFDYMYGNGTYLVAFEAPANNEYRPIFKIIIQNLEPAFDPMHLKTEDVDNDGKEELIISMRNEILILKFAGEINNHNYEVFYYKNNNDTFSQNNFYPCSFYDMDGDGFKDLILPTSNITTYIFQQNVSGNYVNETEILNSGFQLSQNYPNPFNPVTKIKYSIPKSEIVQIEVYDILGKKIKTLLNEFKPNGFYEVEFHGSNLPSGLYFYRMTSGSYSETKKMILLR